MKKNYNISLTFSKFIVEWSEGEFPHYTKVTRELSRESLSNVDFSKAVFVVHIGTCKYKKFANYDELNVYLEYAKIDLENMLKKAENLEVFDALGQRLKPGDNVIVTAPGNANVSVFEFAKVVGFKTEKFVILDFYKKMHRLHIYRPDYKRCDKLVKVSNDIESVFNKIFS